MIDDGDLGIIAQGVHDGRVTVLDASDDFVGDSARSADQDDRPSLFGGAVDLVARDLTAVPGDETDRGEAGVLTPVLHQAEVGVHVTVPLHLAIRSVLDHEDPGHGGVQELTPFVEHETGLTLQAEHVRTRGGAECDAAGVVGGDDAGDVGDHDVDFSVANGSGATGPDEAAEAFERRTEEIDHVRLIVAVHAFATAGETNGHLLLGTSAHEGEGGGESVGRVHDDQVDLAAWSGHGVGSTHESDPPITCK